MGRVGDKEVDADGLRALYKAKHPNAFWADFGDFTYFRMHSLKAVNFVGGFARAGSITPEDYIGAAEDRKDVKTLIVEMTQTSLSNPVVQEAMQAVVEEDARKEKAKAAA